MTASRPLKSGPGLRAPLALALAVALLAPASLAPAAEPATPAAETASPLREGKEGATWVELKEDIAGSGPLAPAEGRIALGAPVRAADAATVPLRLTARVPVEAATLVIDENPSPVAGTFTFAPAMQPLDFELRVRVNSYSNVRLIADTPEGRLMTGGFVKASGGCSAPASRSPQEALAGMGEMRLRLFAQPQSAVRREAQIMIRHPMYSGLQRDQITHLFVPPHFISRLEVAQGDTTLFTMEGGISISENPVFRFAYVDDGSAEFVVRAQDTEGNRFEQRLPKTGG